jgi:hypothetical protein
MENGVSSREMQRINNSKKANPVKYQYNLHWHILESVNNAKYLGCHITSDLRWSDHINNIGEKANRTLGFLRRNPNIGSTSVKENAYTTLVRPTVVFSGILSGVVKFLATHEN